MHNKSRSCQYTSIGLTKKIFSQLPPSPDTCRGGKNQAFDLFIQPQSQEDIKKPTVIAIIYRIILMKV